MDVALDHLKLIIVGDLNLILTSGEYWGKNAQPDTLSIFFGALFKQKKFIDLQPIKMEPTWRNNSGRDQDIRLIFSR